MIKGSYAYQLLGLDISLGGVGAGYRYYFTYAKKQVPSGFYVTPEAFFSFANVKDDADENYTATFFGIGAEIGYQWVWASGFTLDLGIGPMYTIISGNENSGIQKTTGIAPAATIAIGFAF
ncbi:MAG: DUF3575 domain-containing protein [Paludibacteraceae bacterium]